MSKRKATQAPVGKRGPSKKLAKFTMPKSKNYPVKKKMEKGNIPTKKAKTVTGRKYRGMPVSKMYGD